VKFQDYYQTLGVARNASPDDIKRTYRKLAKEWHPDRHPPHRRAEVETKFKQIAEAHEVLSDPEKRKRFDQLGEHWRQGQDFQAPPGGGGRTMSQEDFARMFGGGVGGGGQSGGGGFSDFFGQMFGDMFAGGGRGSRTQRARPQPSRGQDVEAALELSVGEALRGGKRTFDLQVSQPCEACEGEGHADMGTCPVCGGLGSTRATRSIELSIPVEVRDGQVLRLRGLGQPGAGAAGDLLLQLHLVADDVHRLRGEDVEADLVIAPWEALDGTKASVRVPNGTATVRIPAGTRAGARLRLRGQGLVRPSGERGDLIVVVRFGLPDTLDEAQQTMLRELGRTAGPVRGGVREP
jgi:curved DNA-binding protein